MGQLEKIWSDAAAEVHQIVVGPMDNNVYILRCRRTGDAMLIDAANEHEALLDICRTLGVTQVVETHGHWDHIQAVPAVREAGISVAVTSADAGMLPSYDLILDDDELLSVGDLRIKTLATPGHTPGPSASPSRGRTCSSPATPSSPAAPEHLLRERRLRHHHRVDRPADLRPLRSRHPRPARSRHLHHGWRRVAPPPRMGGPGLVRAAGRGSGGAGTAACSGNLTKTVSFK